MTREHKLALILGFSVVLVVGVLISDHFSEAAVSELDGLADSSETTTDPLASSGAIDRSHASAPIRTQETARSGEHAIPGGFSIDGAEDTAVASNTPMTFETAGEALLSEIQRTWNLTQNATPAMELDTIEQPTQQPRERTTLFTPTSPSNDAATNPLLQGRSSEALPEPARLTNALEERREADTDAGVPMKKHRVEEDESLWSIAEQHYGDGALYVKLAEHNKGRVGADFSINVGTMLDIPPKHVLTGRKPQQTRPKAGTTTSGERTYTVADGDTLGEIAQRLLGSSKRWPEIVRLNNIDDPDMVPVGTKLKIPASR